jgi:PQQ-dependent dehydrogenase (methanol/ethanol family)
MRASVGLLLLTLVSLEAHAGTDWTFPAGDYANTRYSDLDQVTAQNVGTLKVAFTFSTGVLRGHEAAPAVAGDTLYVITPYPNYLYALDLKRDGALKWKFEPNPRPSSQGIACCDFVNRGVAVAGGRVFFNTLDAQTVAVDAGTGKELWRVQLGDITKGETMTMAPLVVKDKVLVGNSGGEFGVRGWLTALDVATGKQVWRAYSTGPDADVLIGPDFKPFYAMDQGKDLGVKSWPADAWQRGGGAVWGWISYDPETNLIFYGTSNPSPWNSAQRPGDNKWTSGVFARDVDTGQAKWFYQESPHDEYDYDAVNESLVIEVNVDGRPRKVLARAGRTGYFYLLDRLTGQVLSATPFLPVNATQGVDLKTGRMRMNPDKKPEPGKVVRNICPHAGGGKDWQPTAYSPQTRLVYIPHQNICQDQENVTANSIQGTPWLGANVKMYPGPGGHRGVFQAWDPAARKTVWEIRENFPVWSGALATAGGLAFYGTMDGWFKAVDARTGKLLWQFKTASGIVGQPVSYRGPDGKQYVAVLSGVGGWAGGVVAGDLDTRDRSANGGWANTMQDLPAATNKGGMLYVFALP